MARGFRRMLSRAVSLVAAASMVVSSNCFVMAAESGTLEEIPNFLGGGGCMF